MKLKKKNLNRGLGVGLHIDCHSMFFFLFLDDKKVIPISMSVLEISVKEIMYASG